MKPVSYEGLPILPASDKPWMIVICSGGSYVLYGLSFAGNRRNGVASLSGYDTLVTDRLALGCYYLDTTPVPTDWAEMFQVNGPVLDCELPPLTISAAGNPITFKDIVAAIEDSKTLQALTQVSPDVYVQIWRVMGARVGRWNGEKILWEEQLVSKETKLSN